MSNVATVLATNRYLAQVLGVAVLMSFATYVSIVIHMPPSPWNALWMFAPPIVVGLIFNRGAAKLIMAVGLLMVSYIAIAATAGALGGI